MSISLVFLTPDLRFHLPFPLAYLFAENLILEADEGHTIRGEPQNLYERKVGTCEKSLIEDWDIKEFHLAQAYRTFHLVHSLMSS